MDVSWKKDIKYNSESNKIFLMNNSSNKNNIIYNQNNINNNMDISNSKNEIYSKKKGNSLMRDYKNNENYQSYQIYYINNNINSTNNKKGHKQPSAKMIHNYYQMNSNLNKKGQTMNMNRKNEGESSANKKYKKNIKLMNNLNQKIANVNIDNNNNYINSITNNDKNNVFDINSNLKNNGNIFMGNDIYIASKNEDKNNAIFNNKISLNTFQNNQENSGINNNNKIKTKSNNLKKNNSKSILGSQSQQNIITNNNKILLKTEENYDNDYFNNINSINISKRNNFAFYISPNRNNNINNININNKKSPNNKSAKKEKIKYTYKQLDNDISDYITDINNKNNYSNINIDLFGNNNASKNNYINLYLMNNVNNNHINNNKLYYQNNNNQNISKNNNISGNYYMLAENNINSPKNTGNAEILKNIRVNTTNMTRNNILTERNKKDTMKNNQKSLEDSDCLINIKIKNNSNYINKIINRTNDNNNNNLYINNKNNSNNSKIYIKKIDSKNNKPLIYQKENNNNKIIINKSPNTEKNKKKKPKLKNQKSNLLIRNNILLEKPKNKKGFRKKLYCYNIKIYEIKKCYFSKTYISKNINKSHEMNFTEKISVLIDNNMNTLSINNNTNEIKEPLLIENSFKNDNTLQKAINSENIIQSYSNSKIQQKQLSDLIKKKRLTKVKKNHEKNNKHVNKINLIDKEELEMTFGIEEIQNINKNNELPNMNKKEEYEEGDLYQNEDIQIMTDEEEQEQDNLRITQGKEIINNINNIIIPDKINKGLELLEKIQEKRKNNILELSNNNNPNDPLNLNEYYKKTNTLKPKDAKFVLKNLTKNKKCEILNDVLTDLFEKKEKEAKIFDTEILNYNPIKIEKYEKIFNQEQIQNLESILNKKKMFDFIYDKEEIMDEIKSKKSVMTYNKKNYLLNFPDDIIEETISNDNSINNKIIFSYQKILDINKTNELCKEETLLPIECIKHCEELLNNYEKDYKKGNIQNINIIKEDNKEIEKWSRKDLSEEIKKAEEYVKKMNIEMSKNKNKYEIIEILNTITVDNYNEILNNLSNIIYPINNFKKIKPEILLNNQFLFSEIIIEKAIMEKGYVKLYAKICFDLYQIFNTLLNQYPNNKLFYSENLQSLIISECKQKFIDYQYNINNKDNEENYLIKKKFLGNINFICELINTKLFSQKIGFEFLDILYKNYLNLDEKNKHLNLEGIITLLNKFGKKVFEEKNEKFLQDLDYYMKECLIPIITNNNENKIPEYIKYKIINLIEKQKNNWEESLFEKSITAKGKNKEME